MVFSMVMDADLFVALSVIRFRSCRSPEASRGKYLYGHICYPRLLDYSYKTGGTLSVSDSITRTWDGRRTGD